MLKTGTPMEEELMPAGPPTPVEPDGPSEDDKLGCVLKALSRVESTLSALDERITKHNTTIGELTDGLRTLHQKLQDIEDKTKAMEAKVATEASMLDEKLAAFKATFKPYITKCKADDSPPSHARWAKVTPPTASRATGASSSSPSDEPDAWAPYLQNRGARQGVPDQPGRQQQQQQRRPSEPQLAHRPNTKFTKVNTSVVWVKGYPRDLTTKQLRAEAERLLHLNDIDPDDVQVIVKGFGRSFAIQFDSSDAARAFREETRDLTPTWVDPRTKDIHDIKIMSDKPLFVRIRDKLFAEPWRRVLPAVVTKHGNDARLGQSRGSLWSIVDDCPVRLFTSKPDPDDQGKFLLEAHYNNLNDLNITRDEAQAWIQKALASIA
jgi:uncharacterized coiled-coil protein SlyX